MKFISTYEEFRFKNEEDLEVLEPKSKKIDIFQKNLLNTKYSKNNFDSYIDNSGVIHIKNWINY